MKSICWVISSTILRQITLSNYQSNITFMCLELFDGTGKSTVHIWKSKSPRKFAANVKGQWGGRSRGVPSWACWSEKYQIHVKYSHVIFKLIWNFFFLIFFRLIRNFLSWYFLKLSKLIWFMSLNTYFLSKPARSRIADVAKGYQRGKQQE